MKDKQPQSDLKQCVLSRINDEQVCPRSRLFFHSRECFVWFFWFLSILVGAFAIAVLLYVVSHNQYELYEATHENWLTFTIDALPYLWIFMFGLMAAVAVYNLRHTKNGYRKPLWFIFASSVVLSFAGGSALQFFGLGYAIDDTLGRHMDMYESHDKLQERMWQHPSEGRLVGMQVFSTLSPTTTVIFQDKAGQRWQMDVTELPRKDRDLLAAERKVRVLGMTTDSTFFRFHACGAFPWMSDHNVPLDEMNKERRAFIERFTAFAKRSKLPPPATAEFTASTTDSESHCATMPVVDRIPAKMR